MNKTLISTAVALALGLMSQAYANPTNNGDQSNAGDATQQQLPIPIKVLKPVLPQMNFRLPRNTQMRTTRIIHITLQILHITLTPTTQPM